MLRIVALCETGTRSLLGAVFGPVDVSENAYAEQLLPLLDDGMLLLNDRGFDADDFLAKAAATGASCSFASKADGPRPDRHAFPTAPTSPGSTGWLFASSTLTSA